ncbi:MAG: TIGR00282 family metallophosphoesterase [Planctomycetes bacterium]|nr:TIGR00282 family metallophosphoesterase [Planctomycetota bacterium]MBM4078547.1 TIGR00282 family metallophosphoesterase [Planctomycetota bacterium]MBM4085390.1 TIGR00282 family metallophosphoesterase [Planctomycetota bacterium]
MPNILALGDIVGRPGRRILETKLAAIRQAEAIDFCVANCENAAGGSGVTPEIARELFGYGVDVLTSGDHIWKKKEIIPFLSENPRLLRPANYSPQAAGRGATVFETKDGLKVGVINLLGRVFMHPADCPFRAANELVPKLAKETPLIVVDVHAEATSEKIAMGWHLDGKVTAVFGTHTHIQTADERLLPQGTAYVTDLGMTGPYESVLGRRKDRVLKAIMTQMPEVFDVATDDVRMCGVIISADPRTGKATGIRRIQVKEDGQAG